jgi:chaperonin cofactor prefoldin
MVGEKSGVQPQVESPEVKPAPTAGGLGEGVEGQPSTGGAPTTRLHVVLVLNNEQRTRALAKGMIKDNMSSLKLYLSQGAVKLLDHSRLYVTDYGRVVIYDCVESKFRDDPSRETEIYLSEFGEAKPIIRKLVDYIIDNNKTVFDEDCLMYLYKLQDSALEEAREEERARKEEMRRYIEMERKKDEARKLLKDEIEEYKKRIADLESEVSNLRGRIDELNDIIEDYADFVKAKELEDEFVSYVMDKEREGKEAEIRERYMLE